MEMGPTSQFPGPLLSQGLPGGARRSWIKRWDHLSRDTCDFSILEVGKIPEAMIRDVSVSRCPAEDKQRDRDSDSVCLGNASLPYGHGHQATWPQLSPSSQTHCPDMGSGLPQERHLGLFLQDRSKSWV